MALHRDIYWVGRQWAVTGYGIQACNQKQKGKFDIKASELWEDGVLENIRAETWLNIEDFEKALAVARKHYPEPPNPEPPGKTAPVNETIVGPEKVGLKEASGMEDRAEVPSQASQTFELRVDSWPAKFLRPWRIRIRR
jgi:hypothetical protein